LELVEPPVHTRMTHKGMHLDEVVANMALMKHGELVYPGITRSKLVLVGNPKLIDGPKLRQEGVLCFGIGGGELDEHPNPSEFKCCTDLVVKKLGLDKYPVWVRSAAQVRRQDRTATAKDLELSSLIKAWNRLHPKNGTFAFDRASRLLWPWMDFQQGVRVQNHASISLSSLADQVEREYRDHLKAPGIKKVIKHLREFRPGPDVRPLELGNLFKMVQRVYEAEYKGTLRLQYMQILHDVAKVSIQFWNLVQNYQFERIHMPIPSAPSHENLVCAVVESTDALVPRALRYKGVDVVLNSQPGTRMFQISTRNRHNKRKDMRAYLDLSHVVAYLRRLDLAARGETPPDLPFEKWASPGTLDVVPNMHYIKTETGETLLCGSLDSAQDSEGSLLDVMKDVFPILWNNIRLIPSEEFESPRKDVLTEEEEFYEVDVEDAA
jgi:hypothetical protein